MRRTRRAPCRSGRAVALVVAALGLACSPAGLRGQIYDGDELRFRVGPIPAHWRAVDTGGALLAYRDDDQHATVAVNGRCGLDGDDVPLSALTQHLFLHFTHRKIVSQRELQLDSRAALRTELLAELDGVPKRFRVYVLKKDGCVYDFVQITDPNARGEADDFQRFVQGFATLSTQ